MIIEQAIEEAITRLLREAKWNGHTGPAKDAISRTIANGNCFDALITHDCTPDWHCRFIGGNFEFDLRGVPHVVTPAQYLPIANKVWAEMHGTKEQQLNLF